MNEHFKKLYEENQKNVREQESKTSRLSAFRLVSFLVAFVTLVVGIVDKQNYFTIIGVIVLLIFGILVFRFQKEARQLAYYKAKGEVLLRYCMRFGNEWHAFAEKGEGYQKPEHSMGYEEEAYDLDIFGKASLYQYINAATSDYGQDELAALLVSHLGDEQMVQETLAIEEDIPEFYHTEARQDAVAELIEKEALSLHLETIAWVSKNSAAKTREDVFDTMKKTTDTNSTNKQKRFTQGITAITMVLLGITIVSLVLALIGRISYVVFGVMIVIQFAVCQLWDAILFSKASKTFDYLRTISNYEPFLETMLNEEYDSSLLKTMKHYIGTDSLDAIKKLKVIGESLQIRHNPIVYGILCGVCMYNAFLYLGYARWDSLYGDKVNRWIRTTGKMEALLSLAVLGRVKENYVFAQFVQDGDAWVELKEMIHPLLCQDKAVANDVRLQQQLRVITGSNMSGKTTYLRTLGTNAVLAYAGAPVCATHMQLSNMQIFTSMRVMDDVSQGISTFYAEVLRIRKMIVYSKQKKPMLALIDEIFKGTNSADRIVGAQGVITSLCKPWINAMVSTHDFELCSLAQEYDNIENYHFDEYFEEDKLLFDYTVKQGRCKTTNALHILRMAGICEEARK